MLQKRLKIIALFDQYQSFLTQVQRQAMQLYYFEDLSLSEIANIVVTTRSAIYDAIKKGEQKLFKIDSKMNQ